MMGTLHRSALVVVTAILVAHGANFAATDPPPPEAEAPPRPRPVEAVGTIVSASTPEALRPPVKPRLTLVLSGGGARGAAHIGVLKVLDQLHVVPDLVVGTSMGSIVGGLYSAGWAPGDIEKLLHDVDLASVFSDRVGRDQRTYRRKKDDDLFLIPAKIKFRGWKPWLPPSLLGGNRLELMLESLEYASAPVSDFDALTIPYRAVATDLKSGEAVVIGEGSLATAMRASMSVPAVFAPVLLNGRTLVDGGAVANLPVGIAQALGAGRIIAVDITSPLSAEVEEGSFLTVIDQQNSFLTVANRLEDVAKLRPGDVRIVPDLGDIKFSSFDRVPEAIVVGEKAAHAVEAELRPFQSSPAEWAAFLERRRLSHANPPVVDEVRIQNDAPIDDRIVASAVHVPVGEAIDPRTFPGQLLPLAGLEFFGRVRTEFTGTAPNRVLEVITQPKPYGRNTLQLGVGLENDFEGSAQYALTFRHQTLPLNRRGGEWQNLAQVGSSYGASSEWYQPIDTGMRWYLAPHIEYRSDLTKLYVEDDAAAEYQVQRYGGVLAAGRLIGNWGDLRAGLVRERADSSLQVGSPILPDSTDDLGGWFARFSIDTQDHVAFARSGTRADLSYSSQVDWLGGGRDFETAFASVYHAFSFGKSTIDPYFEAGTNFDDPDTSLLDAYRLGGFGRLSGLAEAQLFGSRGCLARLGYRYEWVKLELGSLSTRAYLGMTLEAGNTVPAGDPFSWDTLRYAGSVYVGADTVIGPAYLAWGHAEGGHSRIYLAIGRQL